MKRIAAIMLVIVLLASVCLTAYAAEVSAADDTIHYGKSEIATINEVSGKRVEVPENQVARTAEEDVIHYGINELNPEDFIRVTPNSVNLNRASYLSYDFAGAVSNSVYSDFTEFTITAGSSAVLSVDICVWSPESNDLEIGIYNWTTGENWSVTRSGGQVVDYSKTFPNLTAGKYSVYVRNLGDRALTTGYILYDLD